MVVLPSVNKIAFKSEFKHISNRFFQLLFFFFFCTFLDQIFTNIDIFLFYLFPEIIPITMISWRQDFQQTVCYISKVVL